MRPAPVFGMLKGEAVEQKDAEDAMEERARFSKKRPALLQAFLLQG
jgi:hypothetical protein